MSTRMSISEIFCWEKPHWELFVVEEWTVISSQTHINCSLTTLLFWFWKLCTEAEHWELTSHPGSRGSSNHTHFLGSFFLGLVSLQHCHGLLHLGGTNPVRFSDFLLAQRSPHTKKEQSSSPWSGGTLEIPACAAARSCQSLAASLWSSLPGWGA